MTRSQEIASTIIAQLGGRRFSAMTGAKNFIALENGVQFDIGRGATNKATKVRVTLTDADLYDLAFFQWKPRALECVPVAGAASGIYAEDLARLFTEATGFDTRL